MHEDRRNDRRTAHTRIHCHYQRRYVLCVYGIDKWKTRRSRWRIPEATLLGMAVAGGSIGAWLGMRVWHHKTMHKKFQYGIPLIILAQAALITWITSKNYFR